MPASWPAAVPSTGAPPSSRASRPASAGVEAGVRGRTTPPGPARLGGRRRPRPPPPVPRRRPARARPARRSPRTGSRSPRSAAPPPCPRWPRTRGRAAASRAAAIAAASASIGSRRSASRVVPAWLASPARSSRHRPCGQIESATATGRSSSTSPRPCSTCSSTKVPTRASAAGSGPTSAGSRPARRSASASVTPSASRRPSPRSAGQRAGEQPGAGAGDAEAGALLVGEADDADRPARREAARAHQVQRGERGDHPERPVVRAAVRHRVQVRSEHQPGAGRVRRSPPRPLVADPVGGHLQPPPRRLPGEPFPQLRVHPGPGEPAIAAGARVPADRGQRRPHPVEAHPGIVGPRPRAAA